MEIRGIDVSKHNGTINWPKVKAAGKDFAFIRLGWCGFDGRIAANGGLDPMFATNVKGAIAAGLHVGVYVYSYATTPAAAKVAALETLELVKPYKLTYPIAFDIESVSASEPGGAKYDKLGKTINTAIVDAFLSTVESAGYYGMLYTYKSFAESYLDMPGLARYDVWIAQYANACGYKGSYGIWQHAGDVPGFVGSCAGINGACDLNIAYKDYAAIIEAAGLNWSGNVVVGDSLAEMQERIAVLEEALEKVRTIAESVA